MLRLVSRCFHPSKEGFKVEAVPQVEVIDDRFHPSKEGFKESRLLIDDFSELCFHPSKEGFKVLGPEDLIRIQKGFHPSKEGFKVCRAYFSLFRLRVSIPQRKVSKSVFGV